VWGISLETARNTALVVAAGLAVFAALSAWIVNAIVSKLLTVAVLGALALVVWSQRASLDDCADDVRASLQAAATDDATCTFFGRDVTIRAPRAA